MAPLAGANEPIPARRQRRTALWVALVLLLVVALSLLVVGTARDEASRRQDQAEAAAQDAAAEVRRALLGAAQALQAAHWDARGAPWPEAELAALVRERPPLLRIERREPDLRVVAVLDSPRASPLFAYRPRTELEADAAIACTLARRDAMPVFSRSYFVPAMAGGGQEVLDLCLPQRDGTREVGALVATFSLTQLLEGVASRSAASGFELSVVEADGTRLARAGAGRGTSVFIGEHVVDLPGYTLHLRADSLRGRPSLIPNVATALVLGLSAVLLALVFVLARDVRRRAQAENALAEALAFRNAMGDSLSTGLRARDLDGRISYVNPAFCAMVGLSAAELQEGGAAHSADDPPYWPPEQRDAYRERQRRRLEDPQVDKGAAREGFETVFMRSDGERFPVMIYEAPLVDGQGRHKGWMGAVVDLSAQRRGEELARQQQERLQATARLATVGEMASLLSHELNQPLSAIASYASGSLNLIESDAARAPGASGEFVAMMGQAMSRIAEQAERAGRVIKSVHDFVRRRERHLETVNAELLLQAVMPLVRLQARKSGARIEVDLPPRPPSVVGDRTMLEQVLLNLTRNAIQSMEEATPADERVLTVRVRALDERRVAFSVIDRGPGIPVEVAERLFTPFFTTKTEGMGIGLSLCRTVIEQHGGALEFVSPHAAGRGTEFRFTLPGPRAPAAPP